MAFTLFAIVIPILGSKMKFSSVITPNAYDGFVADVVGHWSFSLVNKVVIPNYKESVCKAMHCKYAYSFGKPFNLGLNARNP
jgi:hypothetical protein